MWTQQELKERLFKEIIRYLDKGKVSQSAARSGRVGPGEPDGAACLTLWFFLFFCSDVGEGHRARQAAGQDAREPHVRLHGAESAAGEIPRTPPPLARRDATAGVSGRHAAVTARRLQRLCSLRCVVKEQFSHSGASEEPYGKPFNKNSNNIGQPNNTDGKYLQYATH